MESKVLSSWELLFSPCTEVASPRLIPHRKPVLFPLFAAISWLRNSLQKSSHGCPRGCLHSWLLSWLLSKCNVQAALAAWRVVVQAESAAAALLAHCLFFRTFSHAPHASTQAAQLPAPLGYDWLQSLQRVCRAGHTRCGKLRSGASSRAATRTAAGCAAG
jgi:hypothetical protein